MTVTCKPEDLSVKLQVPLGMDGEISYSWTVRVCYEVSPIWLLSKSSNWLNNPQLLARLITCLLVGR